MIDFTTHFSIKPIILFLVLTMIIAPVYDTVVPLIALPQEKCTDELAQAETKYQEGLLDEAIALVNRCLDKDNLTIEESEQAYKLLGKAYHAKGLLAQSKENLRKLLKLIPNWRPNPDFETPSFLRLAQEVIQELEVEKAKEAPPVIKKPTGEEPAPTVKKGGGKKFLIIGGAGAVAAGLVFAFASGGGGGAQQLPNPPPLPPNPQ